MKLKIMLALAVLVLVGGVASCGGSRSDNEDNWAGGYDSSTSGGTMNTGGNTVKEITAADIDGKWAGKYDPGVGGALMNMEYTFKAEGNVLTGTTVGGSEDERIPLLDGKIEGNRISFALNVDLAGQELKFNYTGELIDGKLNLRFELAGSGGSFTVERVE